MLTDYTTEPYCIPGGIRTRNLEIRSLTPYPLGHGDIYPLEGKGGGACATPAGFEPARAEHNGLAGRRLNQLGQSVVYDPDPFFFFGCS